MPCSKLKKLWDGVQNLVNLKIIDLCSSQDLIEIPDLSKAENLDPVHLSFCESLHELHPSILSHPKLTHLDLEGCTKIGSLNIHSKYLSVLYLKYCSSLKEISVTSEEMRKLDLSGTAICALLSSMLSLPKLTYLSLRYCKVIESLSLHSKSLRGLDIWGCSSLKEISVTSKEMTKLDLSGTATCAFSSSMLYFPKFTYFYPRDCTEIESLNVDLKYLKVLYLDGCPSLKEILVTSEEMIELNLSGTAIYALPSWISHLLSLEWLDLSETKVESLDENIKNLPMLKILKLDNCRNLVSLPELPPSLLEVSVYNCISLETEITQQLVLQHTLQSSIPHLYIVFPGDHVVDKYGFHTAESSITIPCLPVFHLSGFIYFIILSKGSSVYVPDIFVSINQDDIKVSWGRSNRTAHCRESISDHVIFWYHDVSKLERINEVYDHFSDITFIFKCKYGRDKKRIKGCAVFPVYATALEFKLVWHDSTSAMKLSTLTGSSDKTQSGEGEVPFAVVKGGD